VPHFRVTTDPMQAPCGRLDVLLRVKGKRLTQRGNERRVVKMCPGVKTSVISPLHGGTTGRLRPRGAAFAATL
jgi:hypothetical protein